MDSSLMNRPSDHGLGYTWFSIRRTPRRWRRRIAVMRTSSRAGSIGSGRVATVSSSLRPLAHRPVDLGIGRAEIEWLELPRLHPFLAQCLRVRKLHQRRGRRVRQAAIGELDLGQHLELAAVADRSVPDEQAVLAARDDLRAEVVGRPELWLGETLHPAGDLAV